MLCQVFDLPRDDPYITSEVAAIKNALSVESGVTSHRALFRKDKIHTRRRVMLAYFGLFMNQMVGINLVVYYMPTVLVTNIGLEPKIAQIIGGCINIMFIVGNTAPALALDRMGRRPTMMYGCAGLGVCMMMASILLSFGKKDTSSAAIAFFFIYMLIFGGTINVVSTSIQSYEVAERLESCCSKLEYIAFVVPLLGLLRHARSRPTTPASNYVDAKF